MLTSFFEKSKPVHFLILGAFIGFGFLWTLYFETLEDTNRIGEIVFKIPLVLATILSIVLLDFIVGKNHLTRKNTYSIFFYSCFLLMLSVVFIHSDVLWANIFMLFALRRIISLQKDKNSEVKIFEASLWISVASIFYFWSLLFFIPLWWAIIKKPRFSYKQMLIPFFGFFTVLLLNSTYRLLMYDTFSGIFAGREPIGLDFSAYNSPQILVPATLIIALLIWTGFNRLKRMSSVSLKERPNYWILFVITATAIVLALGSPEKNGAEMVFLFAPTAFFCANYIEGVESDGYKEKDKTELWFKEILLWAVALFAIVFLFL